MSNIWPEPDVEKYTSTEQQRGEWQFHMGMSVIFAFVVGMIVGCGGLWIIAWVIQWLHQ